MTLATWTLVVVTVLGAHQDGTPAFDMDFTDGFKSQLACERAWEARGMREWWGAPVHRCMLEELELPSPSLERES